MIVLLICYVNVTISMAFDTYIYNLVKSVNTYKNELELVKNNKIIAYNINILIIDTK